MLLTHIPIICPNILQSFANYKDDVKNTLPLQEIKVNLPAKTAGMVISGHAKYSIRIFIVNNFFAIILLEYVLPITFPPSKFL